MSYTLFCGLEGGGIQTQWTPKVATEYIYLNRVDTYWILCLNAKYRKSIAIKKYRTQRVDKYIFDTLRKEPKFNNRKQLLFNQTDDL